MRCDQLHRCVNALVLTAVVCFVQSPAIGADGVSDTTRGDEMLDAYFRAETNRVATRSLAVIRTLDDWMARKDRARQELFEMLGLDPLPERTPLNQVVTGKAEHDLFTVEKLHFQSRPGLYVTGNLYVPKERKGKLPTILYVCGHGRVKKNGVSYGNKTHYQHHGAWFARNGYVCLTIDTLQLGEIEGLHHGTHREGMWWWNARGYTSAGVEAWNCVRALDYLETRPEVDADRIGVTGRSGGGAYSWWISALDERVKVSVPVAGITNLKNLVVDDCVEGHCDCMFQVNTYGWGFAEIAALVAPRPLLIANTDKDRIFPLDGVYDVFTKVRRIYDLYGATDKLGLQITEGPHKDTQELRVHACHWFNRFLKGEDPLIEIAAVKLFEPEELKVFDKLPDDQINTQIQETFTMKAAIPEQPQSASEFTAQRSTIIDQLKQKCFRGWPAEADDLNVERVFSATSVNTQFTAYDFTSQQDVRLRLYVAHRAGLDPSELELVVLNALDEKGWTEFLATMRVGFANELAAEVLPEPDEEAFRLNDRMFSSHKWGMAYVAPRGIGPTRWTSDGRERVHIRRRFMLLGQTLDGMRVWDVRRALQSTRALPELQNVPCWMQGEREMAGIVLYASLFEPDVARLDLWQLSHTHRNGPTFLNVLRVLDIPQAVALAAERSKVRIYQQKNDPDQSVWDYPQSVARGLGWDEKQIVVRVLPGEGPAKP
jgi:dienelactone hydrolase